MMPLQTSITNLDPKQRTSLMHTLMHNLVASGNMQLLSGGEEGGTPSMQYCSHSWHCHRRQNQLGIRRMRRWVWHRVKYVGVAMEWVLIKSVSQ